MRIGILFLMLIVNTKVYAQDVIGYWKSINPDKGFTTSIIAVYEYEDKIYGQLVVTFDEKTGILIDTIYEPIQRAEPVKGQPFLVKICLFWNLEKKGNKYKGGTVLDPRTGMSFACELWTDKNLLVLRGLVGPFGMNEIFYQTSASDFPAGFKKPVLTTLIPILP